jgi:hypothetical protein
MRQESVTESSSGGSATRQTGNIVDSQICRDFGRRL